MSDEKPTGRTYPEHAEVFTRKVEDAYTPESGCMLLDIAYVEEMWLGHDSHKPIRVAYLVLARTAEDSSANWQAKLDEAWNAQAEANNRAWELEQELEGSRQALATFNAGSEQRAKETSRLLTGTRRDRDSFEAKLKAERKKTKTLRAEKKAAQTKLAAVRSYLGDERWAEIEEAINA